MSRAVFIGVHTSHCCAFHGCKYSDPECPVELETARQEYPCESCENRYSPNLESLVWNILYPAFQDLTSKDIPSVLSLAHDFAEQRADFLDGMIRFFTPQLVGGEPAQRRYAQLNVCAVRYIQWVREHMFVSRLES